jgi:hypothetical protein
LKPAPGYNKRGEKALRIIFDQRAVGDDLAQYFLRCGCSAEPVGRHGLEVNPRLPLLNAAAKLEIEGLLRVWRKLHPESSVNVSLIERVDAADRDKQ